MIFLFSFIDPTQIILSIPGILIGFTFHEYAHAAMADRLGDKTPRFQGRLTLNPLMHIDIIGFLLFVVTGFGWAKPVQTNPSSYKQYYKDDLKVSFAGPFANLLVAVVFGVFAAFYHYSIENYITSSSLAQIIYSILIYVISANCMLFVLNLIPIPGFDGFHILRDLFPRFFYNISNAVYRYQMVIWIIFIVFFSGYLVDIPKRILFISILKLVRLY